jgi:hypothetical protein
LTKNLSTTNSAVGIYQVRPLGNPPEWLGSCIMYPSTTMSTTIPLRPMSSRRNLETSHVQPSPPLARVNDGPHIFPSQWGCLLGLLHVDRGPILLLNARDPIKKAVLPDGRYPGFHRLPIEYRRWLFWPAFSRFISSSLSATPLPTPYPSYAKP